MPCESVSPTLGQCHSYWPNAPLQPGAASTRNRPQSVPSTDAFRHTGASLHQVVAALFLGVHLVLWCAAPPRLYPVTARPHERDCTVVSIALTAGLRGDRLRSFQRCRQANTVLFLSDMCTADGKYIDRGYLSLIAHASNRT